MEKMEKLLRTYDGLDEYCYCDKCGPASPPADGEVEKPEPPGVKGRGKMLIHLRCYVKDIDVSTTAATTVATTAPIPDLDNGNWAEVAAHCAKVGLDEEALASVYELLQAGNSPVDGSDLNILEQVTVTEQPKKAKPQSDFGKLQIIEEVDEASSVEDSDNSDLLKNGLTKGGEAAIVQMVDRIVKSQSLVEVQNELMEHMVQSEINKNKRASRNLLRMMGQASIEARRNSVLGDRWTLAGAAKQWGIENGIEEAQLDELIGDPETFGDDRALEESGDESSTDSDESEVEKDEPQLEKAEPKVEKVEVAVPVDVEAET
jgi:hypothetical protein